MNPETITNKLFGNDIGPPSFTFIGLAWDTILSGSSEKLVLLTIAYYANQDGICKMSIPQIAVKTSLSKEFVTLGIKRLTEKGLLNRKIGGAKEISYYRINRKKLELFVSAVKTAQQALEWKPLPD